MHGATHIKKSHIYDLTDIIIIIVIIIILYYIILLMSFL
jgi:hypothetical protein